MRRPRGIVALLFCLLLAPAAVACDVTPPPDLDTVVASPPAPRSSASRMPAVTPSAVPTRTSGRSATPAASASPSRSAVSRSSSFSVPAVASGATGGHACAARDLALTSSAATSEDLGSQGDTFMHV
ncbi:hypothetical protein ACWGQ5_33950 [Streptomyces sp. NPDC055722]